MADLPAGVTASEGGERGDWELTTVADDEAVFFRGAEIRRMEDLEPGRTYRAFGQEFTTLPRPPGERLATVATVNDVHFGETVAGHIEGIDIGPVMRSAPGERPYPEVMNSAAAAEIESLRPDAVVAKGDLTATGTPEEYAAFEACYRPVFGDRLFVTRGNHDNRAAGAAFDCPPAQRIDVPGAVLALLDTSRPGKGGGALDPAQLDWLDDLAAATLDAPLLVFGHHPCWQDLPGDWAGDGASLDPSSSAALVALAARRPAVVGYAAGHTHRNRVRYFPETGTVPFIEVACVKDFPGSWAEYRVFEGGILQVHRRLSRPEAVAWSEQCRAMVFGLYPQYAFGALAERCLALPPRWG